jgi:hypothetical protein
MCFRNQDPESAALQFEKQQVHDQIKREFAAAHDIVLHEIKYSDAATIPAVMALALPTDDMLD